MQRPTSPVSSTRWLDFRNDSGESIPPYGLVRVAGTTSDADTILAGYKPDTDNDKTVFANSPGIVSNGYYGVLSCDWPLFAAYDTADGTPVAGEEWGVENGGWKLRSGKSGFIILGGADATAGVVLVRPTDAEDSFWAYLITENAAPNLGKYDWQEYEPTVAGTSTPGTMFTLKAGGRSGTLAGGDWASSSTGQTGSAVAGSGMAGAFVRLRRGVSDQYLFDDWLLKFFNVAYGSTSTGGSTTPTLIGSTFSISCSTGTGLQAFLGAGTGTSIRLEAIPASATQTGAVNLSNQQLGAGTKTVDDLVVADSATVNGLLDALGGIHLGLTGVYTTIDSTSVAVGGGSGSLTSGSVYATSVQGTGYILAGSSAPAATGYYRVGIAGVVYDGATGSFTTADAKTVTVKGGIITSIV